MNEMRVGTRELKTHLSKYLRRVKAGETIIVTERGKVIGQIAPVSQSLEERMKALVNAGLAQWDGKKLVSHQPLIVNQGPRQISDLVSEDRDVDYLSGYQRPDETLRS
jgi:prevent-host-death family protein